MSMLMKSICLPVALVMTAFFILAHAPSVVAGEVSGGVGAVSGNGGKGPLSKNQRAAREAEIAARNREIARLQKRAAKLDRIVVGAEVTEYALSTVISAMGASAVYSAGKTVGYAVVMGDTQKAKETAIKGTVSALNPVAGFLVKAADGVEHLYEINRAFGQ